MKRIYGTCAIIQIPFACYEFHKCQSASFCNGQYNDMHFGHISKITCANRRKGIFSSRFSLMIHRKKHGGEFRSTARDIVLKNKKTLFSVGIEFLK